MISRAVPSRQACDALSDRYNLQRFVDAQGAGIEGVLDQLRQGEKTGHWMWFIFPQLRGLGHSVVAQNYAISSLKEAQAYLDHPVLGPRLRECTDLVVRISHRSIQEIFGYPDWMKFRSCMTLFSSATADNALFASALDKYFGGLPDPLTLQRI